MEIIIKTISEKAANPIIEMLNSPIFSSLIGVLFGMFSTVVLSSFQERKKNKYIVDELVLKELYKEYLIINKRKITSTDNFLNYEHCNNLSKIISDQLHNILRLNMNCKALKQNLIELLNLTSNYDKNNITKIYEQLEKIVNKIK